MAKGKKNPPPRCAHCGAEAFITDGRTIYGYNYHDSYFWKCPTCPNAYVGCHGKTKKPLGRPANAALRRARSILHEERIDPLWKTAIETGDYQPEDNVARSIITKTARSRVYWFIADKLGIERWQSHVGEFDLEQCRAAWVALKGVDFPMIRAWAKKQKDL